MTTKRCGDESATRWILPADQQRRHRQEDGRLSEYRLRLPEQRPLEAPRTGEVPDPVGYDGRTVLFDEAEIDAYIEARSRRSGTAGRPPRTAQTDGSRDATFAARLRQAVAAGAGEPDVSTLRGLASQLSLNTVTLGERLRGERLGGPKNSLRSSICSPSPPQTRTSM